MTCIAGLVAADGSIWMGGDSAGVDGYALRVREDPKVFFVKDFLFGFTTSFRMGQLLQHCFVPPERKDEQGLEAYLCGPFVDAMRACFKSGGYIWKENERESGGRFLLGHAGRLFMIDTDFHVGEARWGMDAVGCGSDIAMGALFCAKGKPEQRVRTALEAAAAFSAAVRPPFVILKLKKGEMRA